MRRRARRMLSIFVNKCVAPMAVMLIAGTSLAGGGHTCEITFGPGEPPCGSSGNVLNVVVTGGAAPFTYDWNLGTADPGWAIDGPDNLSSLTYTAGPPNGPTGTGADFTVLVYDATGALTTCSAHLRCAPGTPPAGVCRMTGGGNDNDTVDSHNKYTFGGQAGAPTASQPQPFGEWTHTSKPGSPAGKWTFHAGTASAPPGTEIDLIQCCDPGWCAPARPAPNKQIDFEGVGTFKNIFSSNFPPGAAEAEGANGTYHWFEVHAEDLGESGSSNSPQNPPGADCPAVGFNCAVANCDCPDFYRITIYTGFAPSTIPIPESEINKTDVIYQVYGYLDGGNLQIHPAIGDVNDNLVVNINDMLILLNTWNTWGQGDVNGDYTVNADDLLMLINSWGQVLP